MAHPDIRVLVMAVGSPLGQSILKAVQQSALPSRVFVADISRLAAGFHISQAEPVVLPLVKDADYFERLTQFVNAQRINVVFPVIAPEHKFFAQHEAFFRDRGVHIVSCAPDVYELCNDKYRSMVFLRERGIGAPDTELCVKDAAIEAFLERNTFPVLLKPRFGASSADIFKAIDKDRLFGILRGFCRDYFVVQTFLDDPRDYTVGTYISRDRTFRATFVIERELKFGLSYRGKVICDEGIRTHCLAIGEATQATHSINVQLKMVDGKPFTYEINPRLSSTTSVRAHFGFNEPDLIMRDLFGSLEGFSLQTRTGQFMRYWQEAYLEDTQPAR